MSWTCQCAAINGDDAAFCSRCGHPFAPTVAAQPAPPPPMPMLPGQVPFAKASSNSLGWKIGAIAVVLVFGVIFGTLVATTDFSKWSAQSGSGAQTTAASDVKSQFTQSFDASFQRSCRVSAMRGGLVSQATADRYCDCALSVFHETHSMSKVVERCRQYALH